MPFDGRCTRCLATLADRLSRLDLPVYAIDAAITITHAVTDRFGNPIDDAMVTTSSTPVTGLGPTSILSIDSFSYGGEGVIASTLW